MGRFHASSTQRLSRESIQLSAGWRLRDPAIVLGVVICLVVVGAAAIDLLRAQLAAPSALARLQDENARVRGELAAARVELQVERATHAELQRHVVELQEQVADLNQQLEFLSSRTGQATGRP